MTDPATQLDALLDAFGRLGITVRREHLEGAGGGLCTLGSTRVLFLDLDSDLETQLERSLSGLAAIPQAESLYLMPALRERVERLREP